jgi:serine/threonine protein kinase
MLHTVDEMTPPQRSRCPRCGNTISPRAAPQGLCPACLLTAALEPAPDVDELDLDGPFPYRIITLLGGDPGRVTYLAQTRSGAPRYVALKVVGSCHDPASVLSRFARLKHALIELRDPGVVPIVDAGRLGADSVFVASDYIAGSSLRSLLDRGALDAEQRTEVARQLDRAVRAIHDRELAHMKLDASRVKVAGGAGMRAAILGVGSALILDGVLSDPTADRRALARIVADLGVSTPQPG